MKIKKMTPKHILVLILMVTPLCGQAQTRQNYVKTTTYLDENQMNGIVSYQYYDGLGRPSETATNGMGTDGKYVYTMTTYDQDGREAKKYQPSVGGTTAEYQTEAELKTLSRATYNNDMHGYSVTAYDALDRPVSMLGAGDAWYDNDKKTLKTYGCNRANSVKKYLPVADNTSAITPNGYYQKGLLDLEKTVDEDGKTIEIYKDFHGHTILERRADNNDTYYVYNGRGQLRFVLSPMYQETANLNYYAYEYRYDTKGRCVWKKLPSCEYIQYWYDRNNRLAYMQDGNLRQAGKYRFYLYDEYSRQVVQGLCTSINTAATYQATVSFIPSASGLLETGYTMDEPFNHGTMQLELANYYDGYGFVNTALCGSNVTYLQKADAASAAGLPTGNIVSTSIGGKLLSVVYYDEKGQVIDERKAIPSGTVSTQTQYTFTGKPASVNKSILHNGTSYSLAYIHEYYMSNDQLKKTTLQYGNTTPATIGEYIYNSLGQLKTLKRGGMYNASYLYDIQGHMTGNSSTVYSENLMYTHGGRFNGSVAVLFSSGEEPIPYFYTLTYDELNRLTKASYSNQAFSDHDFYDETITYDANGNVLTLKRNGLKDDGTHGLIDDLSMVLDGNQVINVSDGVSGPNYAGAFHFVNNSSSYFSMAYDKNGNLTKDLERNISQIEYNFLNLPKKVQMNSTGYISYVYDALGTRLSKSYYLTGNGGSSGGQYSYIDDLVFHNGSLEHVRFDGGYISFTSGGVPQYHYFHTDHLGSVRVVTDASGNVEQRRSYYPFGASFRENATTDGNRLKFSGKELERLHGLNDYDFGARTYVPTIARFTQMDPLCEKYYHISPYAYCANDPINAIDPDGKRIFIDFKCQDIILPMINKLATGTFGISDDGYLYLESSVISESVGNKHSDYYRDQLLLGIKASKQINVSVARGTVYFMKDEIDISKKGEGFTVLSENGAWTFVSGKDNPSAVSYKDTPELILVHELVGHAIPAVISPSLYDERFDGLAVTAENIVRKEIGETLRPFNSYESRDWSLDFGKTMANLFMRQMFPAIDFSK